MNTLNKHEHPLHRRWDDRSCHEESDDDRCTDEGGRGFEAKATDQEWLEHFMNRMAKEENRAARFVSHAVYIDESGHVAFEGECLGEITHDVTVELERGIPLSAVFKPMGFDKVYSAMTAEEKNAISHRGWSVKKLREWMGISGH